MDRFFKITDKVEFVKRLLDLAFIEKYIIVLEFQDNSFCDFGVPYLKETRLPNSAKKSYDSNYFLKAFEIIKVDYYLTANLFAYISELSIYDNNSMILLIADDFHNDCFSCSEEFHKQYEKVFDTIKTKKFKIREKTFVTLDESSGIAINEYPFSQDLPLIFLGEITNMPEHGIFIGNSGKIYKGYHIWNFRELTEDET